MQAVLTDQSPPGLRTKSISSSTKGHLRLAIQDAITTEMPQSDFIRPQAVQSTLVIFEWGSETVRACAFQMAELLLVNKLSSGTNRSE